MIRQLPHCQGNGLRRADYKAMKKSGKGMANTAPVGSTGNTTACASGNLILLKYRKPGSNAVFRFPDNAISYDATALRA
jgi:hypothetical protein